jgi:hypothetical protein|nr:MAG TPA: NICKEL AND COBALT RESISTANCE PROTEIN BINDING PROTEIN, SENSOR PROTEIN [Caudoviricetes sp.]
MSKDYMDKMIKVTLIGLILLLLCIIGIMKGAKMKPKEPIPQEVTNFLSADCDQEVIFERAWRQYKVYTFDDSDEPQGAVWGLPQFILFDGKNVRWADDDETTELMYLNNQGK